jgi:uncharacterized damage-inducible protein DinB
MSLAMLKSLFAFKRWSNRELFDTLEGLPDTAELTPMIRTLGHIYVTDRIFRAHLSDEPHAFTSPHLQEIPTLAALRREVEETDEWYLQYVSAMKPEALDENIHFQFTDGDMGTLSREEILHHISTHGCYHRGNVGQMLRDRGVPPPRDLYTRYLHQIEPARRN